MNGFWDLLLKGGIMMPPLILASVIGLAVTIERALFLRRRRIVKPEILDFIHRVETAEKIETAFESTSFGKGPFWNIIRKTLEFRHETREEMREAIADQGRQEARHLERGLVVLETIAGIAPLMGLLGTVLGMIKVFRVISEQGLGQTQALSGGIAEALITTVVGLFIAIPALVAFYFFNHRVEDLILEIEKHTSRLLKRLDSLQGKERRHS
ncbi:MAG TPA: MotA/TolQ/ExbB proton channel family protein [bacterium]|nr:MotA/TolQ/ExbB proton channel family protein [bacterium]